MDTYRDEYPNMMDEDYGDEVLNAGWLPRPLLEPEHSNEHEDHPGHRETLEATDLDDFMSRLYSAQE